MDPRLLTLTVLPLSVLACTPPIEDHGGVCASTRDVDGQLMVIVEANSLDCSADHRGAKYESTIEASGQDLLVQTTHKDGRDPDHACAGPLFTSCELPVDEGTYTVEFDGIQQQLVVPTNEWICFAGAWAETEG